VVGCRTLANSAAGQRRPQVGIVSLGGDLLGATAMAGTTDGTRPCHR